LVIKPVSKKTTTKKSVSKGTRSGTQNVKDASSDVYLQQIIDVQAKQIQVMEKMIQSLDAEVREIKKLVKPGVKTTPAAVTPKSKVSAKDTVKTIGSAAKAKIPDVKAASKPVIEGLVEIPQEISDRINALTAQKKVTQTQLGKETDLSQKKIHEIASRKVRDLHQDVINRLTAVIKKYETQ
jgi:DNA-binding Xre family transcriptional regulator